ncbi:MAG: endonuclease/exonuclease/phosphatase family protein [Candidatus Saccharibacteria bacterium]
MQVSILQWNVWYKEDIQNIAAFLKACPADIICLQELTQGYQETEPDTIEHIARALGYRYYGQGMPLPGNSWVQANAIFTRFPLVSKSFQYINEPIGTNGFDDEYRSYVEVTLQIDDTHQLTVGTTHMSYTDRFASTPRKEQEADKLTAILRTKQQNFTFTGDLNAAPDSTTVNKVSAILRNAGPAMSENTWTTKPFSYMALRRLN